MVEKNAPKTPPKKRSRPFRSAVLRGLGVLAPPLLTVVIFIWIGGTTYDYVIRPVKNSVREALVWYLADIRDFPSGNVAYEGDSVYRRMSDGRFVPVPVYEFVAKHDRGETIPSTSRDLYRRYVELNYLRPYYVIPFILSIFLLLLYLLGKSLSAGIGRFFSSLMDKAINRVPVVRNVYSGVKQVSDFMFSERNIEFNRIVAVEFPRKGIWSIGFVTGESFLEIQAVANEPVLTIFIGLSPLPFSGYTVQCLKSECVDLNITFDQACQFLISCGVIVPSQQQLPKPSVPVEELAIENPPTEEQLPPDPAV